MVVLRGHEQWIRKHVAKKEIDDRNGYHGCQNPAPVKQRQGQNRNHHDPAYYKICVAKIWLVYLKIDSIPRDVAHR